MNRSNPKLEEFARRHGYSSFQEMLLDRLRQRQLDQPEEEEANQPEELYGEYADEEYENVEQPGEWEEAEQEILRQIEELLDRFPDIENPESLREEGLSALARMKGGPDTLALWQRIRPVGLALSDAFLLVNLEDILARQREAAWQAAVSSLAGRAHLLPAAGGALDDPPVPGSVFEWYRALNPNVPEQDIRAHYHRVRKKK